MKRVAPSTIKQLGWVIALAAGIVILASFWGISRLDWRGLLDPETVDYHIFWNLRVSRVLTAFLAGAGLAVCGMVFQALFLNTLATPFTLGVSGGASCGAAFVIFFSGLPGLYVGPSVTLGSMIGAGIAMALIWGFSQTRIGHQRHVMLLAGVAVSFFFSSLLLFIQALSSFYQSFQIIRWLMGGIAVSDYREVLLLFPILLPGFVVILRYQRSLNLILLGDHLAQSRGLNVPRVRKALFLVVSIMVAVIVSVTGPIGFIGLVVPHICRIIWGGNHRILTPASLLVGGTALVACDLVARLVLAPTGIPVGVVTSLLGAPFFFYLLLRKNYRF